MRNFLLKITLLYHKLYPKKTSYDRKPLALIILCHRDVGAKGLVGFGGRITIKEKLLSMEKKTAIAPRSLSRSVSGFAMTENIFLTFCDFPKITAGAYPESAG